MAAGIMERSIARRRNRCTARRRASSRSVSRFNRASSYRHDKRSVPPRYGVTARVHARLPAPLVPPGYTWRCQPLTPKGDFRHFRRGPVGTVGQKRGAAVSEEQNIPQNLTMAAVIGPNCSAFRYGAG
jgi:hypothetical protein